MQEALLDLIMPHYCYSCGVIGSILCEHCKNDIIDERQNHCLKCGLLINDSCKLCRLPYQKSWTVNYRTPHLASILSHYKYDSVRSLAVPLANILASSTPAFPKNTVIVPIPTIRKHIRQRGFDHSKLLATRFAKLKDCKCRSLLIRKTSTRQVGANKTERIKQAKSAFSCTEKLDPKANYVLLDDICTTGSTLKYAAKELKLHGAKHIWVAVIAKEK